MSAEGGDRREGRGRLSKMDQLPPEADEDVAWAMAQLRDNKLHQNVIRDEFNARLLAKDLEPISPSGFNRFSVKKAIAFRKLDQQNRLFAEISEALGTGGADQATVGLGELLKVAIYDTLEGGELKAKDINELARGLSSVVSAQKSSADYRRRLEEQHAQRLKEAADAFADAAGKEAGVSPETLAKITNGLKTGQFS